jgi:hypothetical protein
MKIATPAPQTHIEASDMTEVAAHESKQLLHLVLGGELKNIDSLEFKDVSQIDVVGVFPNYESAERAWRAKAQATVDSAQTRYFIVHLHRMMAPGGLARKVG